MKRYEAYKDSGLGWIGKIPSTWEAKRIKHFAEQITARSTSPNKIALENIESKTGKYLPSDSTFEGNGIAFEVDDIVYGKLRPYLQKVWKAEFAGNAVGDFFVYRSKENCLPAYLKYVMLSDNFTSAANGSTYGAKMPRVSSDFVANTIWYLPTLAEQHVIADYLDQKVGQIDASISAINAQIEDLKAYRQSIISEVVTKGFNPKAPKKDSGIEWIGNIPEGWDIKRLRFLGNTQNGISKSKEFFGEGFPFVSYSDVYKNEKLPTNPSGLVQSSDYERSVFSVCEGDVFFTRTSETAEEIGFSSVCEKTIENATYAGFLIRFRPYANILDKGFSKYYFRSSIHRSFFVNKMNVVTRASLSQDLLMNLPVVLPPLQEQHAIAEFLDRKTTEIDNCIAASEKCIEDLQKYRASLISEAVTGKIDVRDWTPNKEKNSI